MNARPLGRRAFLRGAGSVCIGLPLSLALQRSARAAPMPSPGVPPRYLSFYFGNGLPAKFVELGFDGVMAPFFSLSDKLALLRGLSLPISGGAAQMHWQGTGRFGVGITPQNENSAAGQSLDDALYRAFGQGTSLLNVNMHGRSQGNPATRWYHSWQRPGLPNPERETPIQVFDAIFGTFLTPQMSLELTASDKRAIRYRNSVLDSVVEQYRELSSERSGYSAGVRALLSDHLDLVRSLERQSLELSGAGLTGALAVCDQAPPEPPPEDLVPTQFCTESLCPEDVAHLYAEQSLANWNEVWPLFCELYAVALRCGSTRFGTVGCSGSGDRYPIPELQTLGVDDSAHTLAHGWSRSADNGFGLCVHWLMQKVAHFLEVLDDPLWPDPDGRSVLDNTLVLIGTELGTGGDGQHYADSMSYLLAGASGLLQSGVHDLPGRSDVDLYSTVAAAFGLSERFGDAADFAGHLELFSPAG
ncbi:MAG: DUF1552 domain-containing protein [Myxococcales bacterium]|nr:DUF1552 domain-containing protein [Myxococcales bacterium]